MTRDELRDQAIEIMAKAFADRRRYVWEDMAPWLLKITRAELECVLKGLGDAGFKVIGPTTDDMHRAAKELREKDKAGGRPTPWGAIFNVMAVVGDLTKK